MNGRRLQFSYFNNATTFAVITCIGIFVMAYMRSGNRPSAREEFVVRGWDYETPDSNRDGYAIICGDTVFVAAGDRYMYSAAGCDSYPVMFYPRLPVEEP